jgi:hypothetical protein
MFLKNADEQTIVALAAIYRAMQEPALAGADFQNWGVVAAPRFMGRTTVGFHLSRYASEGAWGISPHVIPHRTLHSPSGTISHALKLQGPNFGVGGGLGALTEALLTAAALLHGQELPGLWVAIMERNPDLKPDPVGTLLPGAFNCALALALVPWRPACSWPRLTISVGPPAARSTSPIYLDDLQQCLDRAAQVRAPVALALDHGGRLEVRWSEPRTGPAAASLTRSADAGLQSFPAETER